MSLNEWGFAPKPVALDALGPGEIGFINAGVKRVADAKVGDTITEERANVTRRCRVCPFCTGGFCGLFPVDTNDFSTLREALEKLSLNDASFSFEAETSARLDLAFAVGF